MHSSFIWLIVAFILAVSCAAAGAVASAGKRAHVLIPLGGGLLAAVALFALIPETAEGIGWSLTLLIAAAGYLLLHLFDLAGLPVCPSCTHSHGFSGPLVAATSVHALVDGWGMIAVSGQKASLALLGVLLLHKIPEGLALGSILRMSAGRFGGAFGLAVLAEAPTLLGGALGMWTEQATWIDYPLALAAGAYLFLGIHAVLAWVRPSHIHDEPHSHTHRH